MSPEVSGVRTLDSRPWSPGRSDQFRMASLAFQTDVMPDVTARPAWRERERFITSFPSLDAWMDKILLYAMEGHVVYI